MQQLQIKKNTTIKDPEQMAIAIKHAGQIAAAPEPINRKISILVF